MRYFSEREIGTPPRDSDEISAVVWKGILVLMRRREDDCSLGAKYPDICPDGTFVAGANMGMLEDAMLSEIPGLARFADRHHSIYRQSILAELGSSDGQPSALDILDLIEFCWKSVGKPIEMDYHRFFGHNHLKFDVQGGRDEFRAEVETIFRRNGIAYELTEQGRIERRLPPVYRSALVRHEFNTGDAELDRLLGTAQRKFLDPRFDTRREALEALEALWDGWERLKTLDGQGDKRAQAKVMLDRTAGESSPKFRDALDEEAKSLTSIGNSLGIRHSETNQEMKATSEHADYLFFRLYSLTRLILQMRKQPHAHPSPAPPGPPPSSSAARPAPATPPA